MRSIRKCPADLATASSLGQLRRSLGLSQRLLSERLSASQPHVAQLEGQHDMLLSTLRRYVTALGGELELIVRLPDGAAEITLANVTDNIGESGFPQRTVSPACITPPFAPPIEVADRHAIAIVETNRST